MLGIDEKYLQDREYKVKDFISKTLTRAEKTRLKEVIKSIKLKYQVMGEDIPSLIDDTYNYQVIMFFEVELSNIKNASFVHNILQKVALPPCVFKFYDNTSFCYAFADKRLSIQGESEIVIDSTVLTTPQPNNAEIDSRLLFQNIKNRNNKRCFYTEIMVKAFILTNSKLILDIMSCFDIPIWYDEHKKLEFYYKLRELKQLQEQQHRLVTAKEKVELNTTMKNLIKDITTYYKETV